MKFDVYTAAYYALLLLAMVWLFYLPQSRIVGAYVNNNTEPVLEGPAPVQEKVDTLILYADGTFSSRTWGKGIYELDGFLVSPGLTFIYHNGSASWGTSISKPLFGPLRIWLNHDLSFYFEKI